MDRTILHVDANNFYASVECLYNPELRKKPVAVAGDMELRHGIVLAKNYPAKAMGVKTGNPLWLAKQLCPDIVFVKPHYDRYLKFSRLAREIYKDYTDRVEAFGLDENWLDVGGSLRLYGSGREIAEEIRQRVKEELGITVSVGVSFNKIFAKLGSDYKKPDAVTELTRNNFKDKIWSLPAGELLYVGSATAARLCRYGIYTIGDIANTKPELLHSLLGKCGNVLWAYANGYDESPVSTAGYRPKIKSIGNSTTTPKDLTLDGDVKITLYILAESVAERLREQNFKCRTVQISLRYSDLSWYERQMPVRVDCSNARELFRTAYALYEKHRIKNKPIRSIGLRACNLSLDENIQLCLDREAAESQKQDELEKTVDNIRGRFGHFIIQRGIMHTDTQLSNLDPKNDHVIHPVSFINP